MWFGEPWPSADERAPVCEDDSQRARTPVGEQCLFCTVPVAEGDRGVFIGGLVDGPDGWPHAGPVPVHVECELRNVFGGAGHLSTPPHAPGSCDVDGGLTYRQSALLVWEWFNDLGGEGLLGAVRYPLVLAELQQRLAERRRGQLHAM